MKIRNLLFAVLFTAACNHTVPVPPPPTCIDPAASNVGGPLPCLYPPPVVVLCDDPQATNVGEPLPCLYPPPPPPLPGAVPRAQALQIKTGGMQGLMVHTEQFGDLPWWDAALFSLNDSDRQNAYAAKHAVGATHAIIMYDSNTGSIYDETGNPYQQMNGRGFEDDCPGFQSAIVELTKNNFVSTVFLGGDDGERGYPVAVRQLPKAVSCLRSYSITDLNQYVVYLPGWDGVFYGWTPEHISIFGAMFRTLLPDGYLGLEFQPGRIPVGNGPADYAPGGMMVNYDVLLQEFDQNLHLDSTWQVAGRLLGPLYNRPSDQPHGDDPHPPCYLCVGSPRGPYGIVAFEYKTYWWVRSQVTGAQIAADRAYLKGLGYTVVD